MLYMCVQVKKMSHMFRDVPLFNQPLSSWDTSKVTDMSFMFLGASAFNHPLNTWNTDSVRDRKEENQIERKQCDVDRLFLLVFSIAPRHILYVPFGRVV